jgi:hypothetical protein
MAPAQRDDYEHRADSECETRYDGPGPRTRTHKRASCQRSASNYQEREANLGDAVPIVSGYGE